MAPVLDLDVLAVPPVPGGPERIFEMVGVDLRHAERLAVTVLAGRLPAAGLSNETAVMGLDTYGSASMPTLPKRCSDNGSPWPTRRSSDGHR